VALIRGGKIEAIGDPHEIVPRLMEKEKKSKSGENSKKDAVASEK